MSSQSLTNFIQFERNDWEDQSDQSVVMDRFEVIQVGMGWVMSSAHSEGHVLHQGAINAHSNNVGPALKDTQRDGTLTGG
jgi:hypothetical protein